MSGQSHSIRPVGETLRRWRSRLGDTQVAVLLFLLCLGVYNANLRLIATGDSLPARFIPFAFWQQGTVFLEPVLEATVADYAEPYWVQRTVNGRPASLYPVVTPLVVAPLYAPAVLYLHLSGWPEEELERVGYLMEKLAASAVTSLAVALMFLALRRTLQRPRAIVLAAIFAFGTGTWSTSSQALWLHGVAELAIVAAIWLLTAVPNVWRAALAGLAVGILVTNRLPDVFVGLALSAAALWLPWRAIAAFAVSAAVPVALVLTYNWVSFHHLAGSLAFLMGGKFFAHPIPDGVAGLLFSPGRGLFVFSPFLLLLPLAVRRLFEPSPQRVLRLLLLAALVAETIFYARTDWRAGFCYGPRFMLDLVPVMIWLLAPIVAAIRRAGWAAFVLVAGFSVVVEGIGAFLYDGTSNHALYRTPESGDVFEPFWDWRNVQYLHDATLPLAPPSMLGTWRSLGAPEAPLAIPIQFQLAGLTGQESLLHRDVARCRLFTGRLSPSTPVELRLAGSSCDLPPAARVAVLTVRASADPSSSLLICPQTRPRCRRAVTAHPSGTREATVWIAVGGDDYSVTVAAASHAVTVDTVIELAGYYYDPVAAPPAASPGPVTALTLRMGANAWRDGFPAGELLPGREIRQRFRCPVVALNDLAVVFANYGRVNRGSIVIELSAAGERLGSTRIEAAAIPIDGWVPLVPQQPVLDCSGRELTITIRSDDAVTGSAVTVWTYPRYYDGEFIQRDASSLRERSLGLLINRGGS